MKSNCEMQAEKLRGQKTKFILGKDLAMAHKVVSGMEGLSKRIS